MTSILAPIRMFFVAIWTILCGMSGLLFYVLSFQPKVSLWVASRVWAPGMLFIAGVRLKVDGLENIDPNQPVIVVANHCSFIDIPALFHAYPAYLRFIAKKELKKMPVVGWYITATGMIFIDRKNPEKAKQSLREAAELIRSGKNVISFPEGRRSRDGELRMFRRGSFIMAQKAGVSVVPIALSNAHRIWPSDGFRIQSGPIHLSIGKPISAEGYTEDTVDDFAKAAEEAVREMRKGHAQPS